MTTGHLLPEWVPARSVMLAWPHKDGDWAPTYVDVENCYWSMLEALSQHVEIWLLLHSSINESEFTEQLKQKCSAADNVQVFSCSYNDTWIRDFAPVSCSEGYAKFTFNGWGGKYAAGLDNIVTIPVLESLGLDVHNQSFVCEGGALETNGKQLLMNSNCVVDNSRNPDLDIDEITPLVQKLLGIDDVIWLHDICLSGDDTDGHIDTIARFCNEETLIYSGPNNSHPDAEILNKLEEQVKDICEQRNWQAKSLPSPVYKSKIDRRTLPCTYANFLICNKVVFVPTYGIEEDDAALAQIGEAFSDYKIVPIRCEALLEQHGSLHCATMQIAKLD